MNNRTTLLITSILFLLLGLSSCEEKVRNTKSPTDGPENKFSFLADNVHIDKALDSLVDQKLIPYVYARIEGRDGETIYEHSSVNNELYPGLELSKDSWFRIWSMSKIVTISTTMDLVEDGILSLDEPVSKYIPEFKDLKVAISAEGKPITDYTYGESDKICPIQLVSTETEMTILHLINHQAGFYYPWTNIECLDEIWKEQDLNSAKNSQELILRLKEMPLVQQPGSVYYYGLNTTVLGLVAEKATGKSLKQLVEERITQPMKIGDLRYTESDKTELLPRTRGIDMVKISRENETDILGAELPDYSPDKQLYLGGEGMIATTDAYADFMRMLMHDGELNEYRALETTTIEEMSAPHTQKNSPWGHNGYNLWVTGDTLRKMGTGEAGLWVSGGYEGTYCWIDRKRGFVGLVMTQMFEMPSSPSDVFREAVYQELWKEGSR